MEKVAMGLTVCCTDIVDTYEIRTMDFIETMDEIEVTTPVYNDALKRGWIGDISFKTCRTINAEDGETEFPICDGHKDILLASVRIWSADPESGVIWKYRFLKK